jgi:ubiquinone/menaquinone biosynthesis C-methylase UbiE
MNEAAFTPHEIAEFWRTHPCGSDFVDATEWKEFFLKYDAYKYRQEPHILEELKKIDFAGKRVLEIGLGQGAEAQRIIEAGAIYNGVDLTEESVERVKTRCGIFSLPYESIQVMNAEEMTFPDDSFDIVFTHGVIHHSPRIKLIVNEIHRVLRPGGTVVAMIYHRNSLNYHVSIRIIRRFGILIMAVPGVPFATVKLTGEKFDRLEKHRLNLKKNGLGYLKMENFIHKSTDGPDNVFSSVFSRKEASALFSKFRQVSFTCHFLNERHFPVVRSLLPRKAKRWLAARFGWHLWVRGVK